MLNDRLSPLQVRILFLLASGIPAWTLTGGAALAGFYTGHRDTRDLDLFWRDCVLLGDRAQDVRNHLVAAGLEVSSIQSSTAHHRLLVRDGTEQTVVDLVADSVAALEPPESCVLQGVTIRVDSPREILVNKLTALLSRSELRDLWDVRELLAAGGDLASALRDAPQKDGGFSPMMLAWVLKELPVTMLAKTLLLPDSLAQELATFRDQLVLQLTSLAGPDRPVDGSR